MPNYIPNSDAGLSTWSANFAALIAAGPATYGLTAGDATNITAADTAFQTAYNAAINPATRTPVTIAAKDTQRIATLATERSYAQRIANNAGVSPSDKVALGLNPRTNPPTPVPAPSTFPVLSIPSLVPGGIIVRYRDDLSSPTAKAKPFGAVAMQLNSTTIPTGTPTASVDLWPTDGNFTKSPFVLATNPADAGKTLYLSGRWVTRRGLVGPWSTIVSTVIPG